MATNLTQYKNEVLLPELYGQLDTFHAFADMDFKQYRGGWRSVYHNTIPYGINEHWTGSRYTTFVSERYGYNVKDFGAKGQSIGLFNFYMERTHQDNFVEAMRSMCDALGKPFPEIDPEAARRWEARMQEYKKNASLWEKAKAALREDSPQAMEARAYLTSPKKWDAGEGRSGRGWDPGMLSFADVGLLTHDIMEEFGWPQGFRTESGKRDTRYGKSHTILVPWYSGHDIVGWKVRVPWEPEPGKPKYLFTRNGTDENGEPIKLKQAGFMGIANGQTEITIVEGELDAIHAMALREHANRLALLRGEEPLDYPTVVATGGQPIEEQVVDAKRRGVKSFTLLLDNDEGGRAFTLKMIEWIQGGEPRSGCFVAALPETMDVYGQKRKIKDLDEFLAAGGTMDEVKEHVGYARAACEYKAYIVAKKYREIQKANGDERLTDKQKRAFIDDLKAVVNAPWMKETDRGALKNEIYGLLSGLSVTPEEFNAESDNEWQDVLNGQRNQTIKKAIEEAEKAMQRGDVGKALSILKDAVESSAGRGNAQQWIKAFHHKTPEESHAMLANIKGGIPTGYFFPHKPWMPNSEKEHLVLNPGLTFICGYRGHGKTTFLNNMALNEVQRLKNIMAETGSTEAQGGVLYFSYEMDEKRLTANLLNAYCNLKISNKPLATIYDFFKNGGRSDKFYGKGNGTEYPDFLERKDAFLKDIADGLLTVVNEPYKVEELLDAIRFYVQAMREHVSLVCIDYAQLLYSEESKGKARYEEIKAIVNKIKDFALETGIPFLFAAQFNRDVSSPASVDTTSIGEAGDLERIADTCIGLFALKELHEPPKEERKEAERILGWFVDEEALEKEKPKTGPRALDKDPPFKIRPGRLSPTVLPQKTKVKDSNDKEKTVVTGGFEGQEGKLYAKLMKNRFGRFPLHVVLEWDESTGKIKPNSPEDLVSRNGVTDTWLDDIDEECVFS